jgi:hypothetical protein
MDMASFIRVHPLASCILAIVVWLVIVYLVLRPLNVKQFNDRMPFVLCIADFLLLIFLTSLPKAFPRAFETFLGHSVYANNVQWLSNGTSITSQWTEKWEGIFGLPYIASVVVGVVWAVVNLVRHRSRTINTIAAVTGALYLLYGLYLILTARFF